MSRQRVWIIAGGLAAYTACTTRAPAPPPPPVRTVQVPPGCERNLAGPYHHADNPAFRYLGEDDGGTLTLAVTRVRAEQEAPADAGTGVSIRLERTAEGFVGATEAVAFTPGGTECPVRFATQAVRCDDQGLTLRSVVSTALDEECHPAPSGPSPDWKEQRLVRGEPASALAPDAGSDAG
jgi:hypothetical protein